ncbi:hypothetical protein D8674_000043 [Pyrus ussuriensis x Pyrus communis]|uniref:Uncharacterized protein n=1 Tax=Pyrus ussuriensis x Pyrus communis TaxID=2448454 RepID=A0A5N5F2X4_9ROSA|nr:hypothetical protein D8674_000043 [Pyrus ussuriensis x Pyrus communis]
MSESGSPSDEGSPSSSSRFELAMLESSGPLLESCTKETLDDFRNCQTLANIGSSSFMSVGNIKLSRRELVDVEKVLKVPKEDIHLGKLRPLFRKYGFQPLVPECQRRAMEKVSNKRGTNTKKGKTPMLVSIDDILFHKGAYKHWVKPAPRPKSQEEVLKITASKRAEAEAIGCAAAIVAREERLLLPHFPTIDLIFPLTMESTDQEGDPSSSREAFILAVDPSSEDDFDNEASGSRDAEDGGDGDGVETQNDILRGLASDEDDS